jgi:UDP-N-acetylmuramoyl-tripeptide--D-alanyl-D-alanine ligase
MTQYGQLIMITMPLSELANLFNHLLPEKDKNFHGVSTDSRTLKPGNLFIALTGENFDGHKFLEQAAHNGAVAAIVNRALPVNLPQIVVTDTLDAMGKLSAHWRNTFTIPLVGITGSNGKTTLKNMMASILRVASDLQIEKVLATEGNLNNAIGVPLTLFRLNSQHLFGVIEMGMNHFGEIAYLTQLTKPAVAVITNAAEAHLEGLKNVAGVAKAKGEIFQGLNADGIAVLNADDPHFSYWKDLIKKRKHLSFGLKNSADVSANIHDEYQNFITPIGNFDIRLPLLGDHNIMNALAATAAAIALNINLADIKNGLETMTAPPGRMHQYFHASGARIIDDTYNANPFSLQAAVNTLATSKGIKIIILGDMKELGSDAKSMHYASGERMREANIDYLFTLGELSAATSEAFGKNARHFTDKQVLIEALLPYLKPDTHILVKGSRSMKMENIITKLIPENQIEHTH